MKSFHPAIKILTASVFIVLMSGFVALKSGAFNSRSATIKLHVARTGKSFHIKPGSKVNPKQRTELKGKKQIYELDEMIASSKFSVATPLDWSSVSLFGPNSGALMSSSKSIVLSSGSDVLSTYHGIFSVPYGWKAKSKGQQLKQGKGRWNN